MHAPIPAALMQANIEHRRGHGRLPSKCCAGDTASVPLMQHSAIDRHSVATPDSGGGAVTLGASALPREGSSREGCRAVYGGCRREGGEAAFMFQVSASHPFSFGSASTATRSGGIQAAVNRRLPSRRRGLRHVRVHTAKAGFPLRLHPPPVLDRPAGRRAVRHPARPRARRHHPGAMAPSALAPRPHPTRPGPRLVTRNGRHYLHHLGQPDHPAPRAPDPQPRCIVNLGELAPDHQVWP